MIKVSLLPLLYIYSQNSGRRVFSRIEISPIQELPRTHKINKSWDFKKCRSLTSKGIDKRKNLVNTVAQNPTKASTSQKRTSQLQGLNNSRNHGKEHSESSLHQLTGSVFLSLQSPFDTAISKCENVRNIVRRHRYHKTPDHTQCISPQLPSLIRRLKKMHGTHSASDDATTDRATVRADR